MPAKGLSHLIIWIFPKLLFRKFATLEEIQKKFSDDLDIQISPIATLFRQLYILFAPNKYLDAAYLLSQQWRKSQVLSFQRKCRCYLNNAKHYKNIMIQQALESIAGIDLLAGN